MNSMELRERLDKAEANVEKTKKTIERHYNQAQKKKAVIDANGWVLDRWQYVGGGPTPNDDAYWAICEYEGKMSDMESAKKKLVEAERIRDNWKDKLDRQLELEHRIEYEIPEVFKKVKAELVEAWVQWDIAEREKMYEDRRKLEAEYPGTDHIHEFFHKWHKMYPYTREESLKKTDEEFRKIEEREAELWLLDLYNRVYAITGEITDCSGVSWGGKCLDGTIVGTAGTAVITTITAGGYNIQKLHLRTLVHEV